MQSDIDGFVEAILHGDEEHRPRKSQKNILKIVDIRFVT